MEISGNSSIISDMISQQTISAQTLSDDIESQIIAQQQVTDQIDAELNDQMANNQNQVTNPQF